MTIQTITQSDSPKTSLLRKFTAWLAAFGEAMDYRPEDYASDQIRQLKSEIEALKSRLNELERTDRRAA